MSEAELSPAPQGRLVPRPVGPSDFLDAKLGDKRRTKRLVQLAEAMAAAPDKSFPEAAGSPAALEGTYRFFANEEVKVEAILEAHIEKTARRAAVEKVALSISDTTECSYRGTGTRTGLGSFGPDRQGFFAHPALAVSADGTRRPLGVLALRTWSRGDERRRWTKAEQKTKEYLLRNEKESSRWTEVAEEAEAAATGVSLIHLMDREADSYEVFGRLKAKHRRFIIRSGSRERHVVPELESAVATLREALATAPYLMTIDAVPVSKRVADPRPNRARNHPAREARIATLEVCALTVQLEKPKRSPHLESLPATLSVNMVLVREVDPPLGEVPIEWILATTEPIETAEQVAQIVEWYRTRWLIEEFFKGLKTGCALEERQLEDFAGLRRALAIMIPIACQVLYLRSVARSHPTSPGTIVLSQEQIEVLRECGPSKLGPTPTVRECLNAVAAYGGHIRNNGDPGWITLIRGMQSLDKAVAVWRAAMRKGAPEGPRRGCDRC